MKKEVMTSVTITGSHKLSRDWILTSNHLSKRKKGIVMTCLVKRRSQFPASLDMLPWLGMSHGCLIHGEEAWEFCQFK